MPETEPEKSASVQIRVPRRRALFDELLSRGVRLTAQRRLIVDIIQNAEQHLDAAALLEAARSVDPLFPACDDRRTSAAAGRNQGADLSLLAARKRSTAKPSAEDGRGRRDENLRR